MIPFVSSLRSALERTGEPLLELQRWIERNHRLWESRLDALGRHLDDMERHEGKRK